MRVKLLGTILGLSGLLAFALTGSASASAPSTVVSMTVMKAADTAPMAGAHVVVFFMPPPGARNGVKTTLPQIGVGTANTEGDVSLTLNTSAVPSDDLGSVGPNTSDSFNATIIAWDSSRQYSISQAIIQEGHTFSYRATAFTDRATGKPHLMSTRWAASLNAGVKTGAIPAVEETVAHTYRYSLITPLNSAPGLRATLAYTYDTSVQRQSDFELPTTQNGLGLTGNQLEETDRTIKTGIKVKDSFHKWVWADYYFVDELLGFGHGGGYLEWQPDHFQGTVAIKNPDKHKKQAKKPIGVVNYKQPKYRRGPGGNWAVRIKADSLPWERSNGTRQENSLGIDFTLGSLPAGIKGGDLQLQDLMTYASITDVTWFYHRGGCPRGKTRVVYGPGTDPVAAGRVMAACVPNGQS
jgi:hypothetical protein